MIHRYRLLGLSISPKSGELCVVVYNMRDGKVLLKSLTGESLGSGSFDEGDPQWGVSADITGFPRVHTAGGVSYKESGYGTALYTGLCMGATLSFLRRFRLSLPVQNAGISSMENVYDDNGNRVATQRSAEATNWWNTAEEEFGLVRSKDGEFPHVAEVEISDSGSEAPDWLDIDRFAAEHDHHDVQGVSSWSADATIEVNEPLPVQAQYYPYQNATRDHLVAAMIGAEPALMLESEDGRPSILDADIDAVVAALDEIDAEAIAACNTGLLSQEPRGDQIDAMKFLLALADAAGVSRDDKERMQLRAMMGMDARYRYRDTSRAKKFDPAERGAFAGETPYESVVEEARMREPEEFTGNPPEITGGRIVLYGPHPNPDDPRIAEEARKLLTQRAELGWMKYAADRS